MPISEPKLADLWPALAGASVWGLYYLTTTLLAGQSVDRWHLLMAAVNVAAGFIVGALAAWFLGPTIMALVPDSMPVLKGHPELVSFGLGMFGWDTVPLAFRLFRKRAAELGGRK